MQKCCRILCSKGYLPKDIVFNSLGVHKKMTLHPNYFGRDDILLFVVNEYALLRIEPILGA